MAARRDSTCCLACWALTTNRAQAFLFAPGTTARAVDVTVVGDQTHEPDETFFVRLRDAENAFNSHAEGGGTIVNDDPLPSVSIDDFAATERNSGTNVSIPLTVRLTNPSSRDISIPFGTRDGTAVNVFARTGLSRLPGGERNAGAAVRMDVGHHPRHHVRG